MAEEALVNSDIEGGLALVKILDEAGFGVVAALWIYSSEQERWRFLVATENGDREIEKKYLEAAELIARARAAFPELNVLDLDRVSIRGANDSLVRGLAEKMQVQGLRSVRVSHNVINGIYIEDAIIHRLAA